MRPRGLGRGLGALLPTAPERTEDQPAGDGGNGLAALSRPSQAGAASTVSAVDRWLWRDSEPVLPEGPPPEPDVPRGTSADLRVVPAAAIAAADSSGGSDQGEPDQIRSHEEPIDGAPAAEPETAEFETDADAGGTGETIVAGGATYAELSPESIRPNPRQPRQVFDPDALADLIASIHEVGLLQPVVVRPVGDGTYELVMGERRWRAAQAAGLATIPAIVKPTGDDVLLRDALLENIQRVQLNPLEEAAAYGQLLDDFGCTQEELATRLGRSRPQVTNTLRLLKLSPPVQRRVAAGVLSAGHAKALLAVEDHRTQEELASRVVAEGLSVRSVEELVATRSSGATGRRPGRALTAGPAHPEIAERLSDLLETRVTISRTRYRGRILIDFASDEDLRRLVELIGSPSDREPGGDSTSQPNS